MKFLAANLLDRVYNGMLTSHHSGYAGEEGMQLAQIHQLLGHPAGTVAGYLFRLLDGTI